MPRRARLSLPNVPVHIIQRGNNRTACFFDDSDYKTYLEWLHEYALKHQVYIYAYVLMTNHVHLLAQQMDMVGIANMMKGLGQRYTQHVNRSYKRTGTLWEGRYRSCIVDAEHYLLTCQRYIELNPVRASMVEHPGEYRWSSYAHNALGKHDPILNYHDVYARLGHSPESRRRSYRALFQNAIDGDTVHEIRGATNGGYCLGSSRFQKQIEDMLKRRVTPGKPGRPRKKEDRDEKQHETL